MARTRHQEGRLEKAGKKLDWIGHYFVYDAQGVRHHRRVNLGTSKGVSKWKMEEKLREIIEKETGQKPADPNLATATIEWYWLNRFAPAQAWAERTRDSIEGLFSMHVLPQIGSLKLAEASKHDLQVFLLKMGCYSESTIRKTKAYLNAMFEAAMDEEPPLIDRNPMHKVKAPQPRMSPTKRYLSMDEIHRLLAELDKRDRLICQIAIVVGLRPAELFGLTWANFDAEHQQFFIDQTYFRKWKSTKTKSSNAWVFVPSQICEELQAWKAVNTSNSPYIFPSQWGGNPLDHGNFLRRIYAAATRAGIMRPRPRGLPKGTIWAEKRTAVNWQSFRRTCGTWLQQHGSLKDVQSHLRHAKPTTTMLHYVQAVPESARRAVGSLAAEILGQAPAMPGLKM